MKIIAVDFDGTLCEHRYPEIGKPNMKIINALLELKSKGAKLILWTCRNGKELIQAIEWSKESHGLEFDAVNEDLDGVKNSDFGRSKSVKIYADVYLDDRNLSVQQFEDLFTAIPTESKEG